jgi:hypothetical protein
MIIYICVCAKLASWRRIIVEEDGSSWSTASLANQLLGSVATRHALVVILFAKILVIFSGREFQTIRSCNNLLMCIFVIFVHSLHYVFDSSD